MYNYFERKEGAERDFYTDLATERRRADTSSESVDYKEKLCGVGIWSRVTVKNEEGERAVLRPIGTYDTLSLDRLDRYDENGLSDLCEEVAKKLCTIFDENGIFPGRILVAGFGNPNLTPDSVGPKSAARIKPTLHISEYDSELFESLFCSEIAVLCPSVPALCGVDSSDLLRAVSERINPDVMIAVDSIMTSSVERLGSTIQISSTGLFPGGMGNLHYPITKNSMGCRVIGIGVPTVMDSRILGEKSSEENLFISPREIDEITNNAAYIIGGAINQAFGLDL